MEEEVSLKDIFKIFKRNSIIILTTFLLVTILGGTFSILLNKKEYTSTTFLLVGEKKEIGIKPTIPVKGLKDDEFSEYMYGTTIVYGDTVISGQASSLYNEIIQREDLLESVIDNLNLNVSAAQLRNSTTMKIPAGSGIIEITVKGITMSNVDEIVDEIAKNFMKLAFEITGIENIRVMNHGNNPTVSNTQNIRRNIAISSILGLVLGVFLAFVMEYLDNKVRTAGGIETRLDLEVLGEIDSSFKDLEDLRIIRTNIQFSNKFDDGKTLVITSPISDYDNTRLSFNLSNIMAEGNKKVILIDSDLRNPSLHEELKLSNEKGLSNILLNDVNLEECLSVYQENKNLHILTAGSAFNNAIGLLPGDGMEKFLSNTKDKYDYIILNSHPINQISDSVALSAVADGVILILNLGITKEKDVKATRKALDKVGANILGAILK